MTEYLHSQKKQITLKQNNMPQTTLMLNFIWIGEGQVPETFPSDTVYVEESSVEEPPYKAWYFNGTAKELFTGPRPNRPPQ